MNMGVVLIVTAFILFFVLIQFMDRSLAFPNIYFRLSLSTFSRRQETVIFHSQNLVVPILFNSYNEICQSQNSW